jgi:hypothetical protein
MAGAAAGMAPGGTNPGGKCPKSFSYFQTSSAMYFSVIDLQPDRLAAAITITTGRHRAAARHHELARIESISFPGAIASGGSSPRGQAKLPHARCAASKS